ncbi:MAG TPA: hypothetical protein DIW61_09210, partial [Candidatus Aminicenantes bacterium]|nr:hypothetical protein [Candidatus Aminicenantes bacterium]
MEIAFQQLLGELLPLLFVKAGVKERCLGQKLKNLGLINLSNRSLRDTLVSRFGLHLSEDAKYWSKINQLWFFVVAIKGIIGEGNIPEKNYMKNERDGYGQRESPFSGKKPILDFFSVVL